MDEIKDEIVVGDPQLKALEIIKADYKRAENYLRDWHRQCNQRYRCYRAPGFNVDILTSKEFTVPFVTEQVDTLVTDMMEKLWYKNEPCSIYPREEAGLQGELNEEDANAKREFMSYLDKEDSLREKTKQAIRNACLYGIAPSIVNYCEEYEDKTVEQDVPVDYGQGPVMDDMGQPVTVKKPMPMRIPVYRGASVENVDPIDLFFTEEKREVYDEHPIMVRSFRTMKWFEEKSYILWDNLSKLEEREASNDSLEDLLGERRDAIGYGTSDHKRKGLYSYVEWHGYADLDGSGKKLWILGMGDGRVLLRMDDANAIFDLGHPNIVIGNIDTDNGEIRGISLLDKIYSCQQAQDALMSMWIMSLRQVANPMWIGNSQLMKTKQLYNEAGKFIDVLGDDINKVLQRVPMEQISKDIYAGMEMMRNMGQNASGINDPTSGVAEKDADTLGEIHILATQSALRMKGGYLSTFEHTWVQPVWEMRNQINMTFVPQDGYLYSVVGDSAVFWRKIDPTQIRSAVDFVCEASNRENQRVVVIQQILQTVNLIIGMIPVIGALPVIKLLEKLYEDGYGWKRDEIKELLPMDIIIGQMVQQQAAQQQQMIGASGQSPQTMSQPKSEGDAVQSANAKSTPQIGQVG